MRGSDLKFGFNYREYDIANIVVGCCIRRDNDCDHDVYRFNDMHHVHNIGKAIRELCLFIFTILHGLKGHSENLYVFASSSCFQQNLVFVGKFSM